ncbi:hypothetical protein OIDMADRAFT_109483 [Oidiodendron maius Zn]|uniref:ATP-dependent RNA helicase n=1 Tax=Oidiodendron maius (strain Zn) TaxID=913774 RepID=A0A0C3HKB6_OIDMZ|nr:hypothetical protein OIDMADRAFT_109483 [Oidiodendron maius Zn]
MFNACRRGPASLSRVLRAGSTLHLQSARPSTLSLITQCATKPSIESRWVHVASQLRQQATGAQSVPRESVQNQQQNVAVTKFQELIDYNLVHPNVVNEITRGMGLHTMTEVQSKTINQALRGDDIIAQARTGTGKTIGFLLPMIQNILRENPDFATRKRYSRARPSDIRSIIISPTRELAEQIAVEAEKLCANTDLRVQVAVGGNSKRAMLRKMQMEGCHLLVATPGRLNDLLTDPYSRVSAPKLTTLVLDEADRLLDDGFSKDIEDIIQLLPDRREVERQTLLFSATVPKEVMHLVRRTLKSNFHFVQTVQEGQQATHEKVPQRIVTIPGIENYLPCLLELAKREISKAAEAEAKGADFKPFKAIVYFNSTANVELAARIFEELRAESGAFGRHPLHPTEIIEMHSRLTQERRTRASDRFRRAKSAILFSTDVTARGMHFPNVSHVIQMGTPPNQEQYVHRIGRTGRADQTGEGFIFIPEHEIPEARRRLRGLPVSPDKSLEASKLDMSREAQLPAGLATSLDQLFAAVKIVDRDTKIKAYMSCMGQPAASPVDNVQALNRWTKFGWGWPAPPAISQSMAMKLNISRVPGINIQRNRLFEDRDAADDLNGPSRSREGRLDNFPDSRKFGRGGDSSREFGRDSRGMGRGGFDRRDRSTGRGGYDRRDRGMSRGSRTDDASSLF